jgi:tetratricopeptide (TPR) repeat protein
MIICRALGDPRSIGWTIVEEGVLRWWLGQAKRSERLGREALALFRELDDQSGVMFALVRLACAKQVAGEHAESVTLAERVLGMLESLGINREGLGWVATMAGVYLHGGHYARARALAEQSLMLVEGQDQRPAEVTFPMLGLVALAHEAYDEAKGWLEQNIVFYQRCGMRDKLALAQAVMGYVNRALGDPAQAWQQLGQALRTGAELRSFFPIMFALPASALLLADRGQVEEAVERYALASKHPFVGNSQWFEDVAGQEIASLAESLPPEVVAAAQERGRTADLWETVEALLEELGCEGDGEDGHL